MEKTESINIYVEGMENSKGDVTPPSTKGNVTPPFTKDDFRNISNLEFTDISSESDRVYHFPNGSELHVSNPLFLHTSTSGGHRLFDAWGNCYYIRVCDGWYIKWRVKEGEPHFVK